MSYVFMMTIATLYGGASVGYLLSGKWRWALVAACWGVGNAVLAGMSR